MPSDPSVSEQVVAPMSNKARYALIVTVEGLGTNLVGCYGGAIGPTKNWDSFACRSIVFDQFWADTLRPIDVLESMWTGKHFASRSKDQASNDQASNDPAEESNRLLDRAMLITDSIEIVEESTRGEFGSVLLIEAQADESDEDAPTQITRLFEAALGQWATQLEDFPILWIHSRGLNGDWDAPYEYRCVMCDEGDPEPPFGTSPGKLTITEETDPDEVFGLACAMGAQAMAFDDAWSMIEEILGELGIADECLQVLAGVQGYPVGEHGSVGPSARAFYAESLHLPLVVRPGGQLDVGVRVPFIVQPNSVWKTVVGWMGDHTEAVYADSMSTDLVLEIEALPAELWPIKNQMAYSCGEGQVHVAVPAWSCRWSSGEMPDGVETERVELFATPDDRWQQNEVSQRAVAIVEALTERRDAWLKCCLEDKLVEWTPLSSELTHPIR